MKPLMGRVGAPDALAFAGDVLKLKLKLVGQRFDVRFKQHRVMRAGNLADFYAWTAILAPAIALITAELLLKSEPVGLVNLAGFEEGDAACVGVRRV